MSRAEEAALKAYPQKGDNVISQEGYRLMRTIYVDGYEAGYEQAAKDLTLTIDAIEHIHTFLYAVKNNKQGAFTFTRLTDEQYEEVLRRFNNRPQT